MDSVENEEDKRIRQYLNKDTKIPAKINNTFDTFIKDIRNNKFDVEEIKQYKQEKKENKVIFYRFKKILTVAASFAIIVVASNVYAKTQGYENIFFLIKDLTTQKQQDNTAVFSDKDIIISYKYFNVTEDIQMQVNELQVKNNKAKLYLLVKEEKKNQDTPFMYKVYNEKEQKMYDSKSKRNDLETIYTEVLELSNYSEETNEIKLEIYNKDKKLIKNVKINLKEKTIEARTENQEVKKISQIELKKFIKNETNKLYSTVDLKNKEIIIIDTYDIYYKDGKYIVKYLFMMPSEEEIQNDKVENSQMYLNTIEFTNIKDEFKLEKIEKPEKI